MRKRDIIENTPSPRTRESLAVDLRQLGLTSGMTVIVHCSLYAIGWVSGGAVAVVQALQDAVTEEGTLVMPTHSFPNTDGIPEAWYEQVRRTMPAYDPRITPTIGMGAVAETFQTFPYVERSAHPFYSMAAWGKNAKTLTKDHPLDDGMGEHSPLAHVYHEDGSILFIGTHFQTNTSFHLGEIRSGVRKHTSYAAPIIENGSRVWKPFVESDVHSGRFAELGEAFEKNHSVNNGNVGSAPSKLFSQREAVDFSEDWFRQNVKGGF